MRPIIKVVVKKNKILLFLPEEDERGDGRGEGRDGEWGEEVGDQEGGAGVNALPALLVVPRPQPSDFKEYRING